MTPFDTLFDDSTSDDNTDNTNENIDTKPEKEELPPIVITDPFFAI